MAAGLYPTSIPDYLLPKLTKLDHQGILREIEPVRIISSSYRNTIEGKEPMCTQMPSTSFSTGLTAKAVFVHWRMCSHTGRSNMVQDLSNSSKPQNESILMLLRSRRFLPVSQQPLEV